MLKLVIRDYFRNFFRWKIGYDISVCLLALLPVISTWTAAKSWWGMNWMAGVPVLLTVFGGVVHAISLAPMMYLVPLSKRQREDYIQKMRLVRILAAVLFTVLWDIAAWCAGQLRLYNFLVQILCVLIGSYMNATLGGESQAGFQVRPAFGGLRHFVAAIRVSCAIGMWTLGSVCMGELGRIGFFVSCGVLLVVFVPLVAVAQKHWPTIRANFADYEMACAIESVEHSW